MPATCKTIKLTKAIIDKAEPIEVKGNVRQMLYFDSQLRGFGLCVGKKTKTFFAQRFVKGKLHRITIGRYGEFTVHQARTEAQKLLGKMAQGINPVEERRRERVKGITLSEGWESYLVKLENDNKSPVTIKNYRYLLNRYLSDWLNKPLAEFTIEDARSRHKKIARDVSSGKYTVVTRKSGTTFKVPRNTSGEVTANSAMRICRAIYNDTMGENDDLPRNPFAAVRYFKQESNNKSIPNNQLKDWYQEIQKIYNPIRRDYLIFTLFTGLRRTSASEIKWEHVNLDNAMLHIPKPKGGRKRAFNLPLSDYLVQLLREVQKRDVILFSGSPWVFPAHSESGHIEQPNIKTRVPFSVHGLRGTFMTVAESLGLPYYSIKLLVNHTLPKNDPTAGYINRESSQELEKLREPMQQITDKLLELTGQVDKQPIRVAINEDFFSRQAANDA